MKKFTDRLINEILCTKVGETVIITSDTYSDENVIKPTAVSVYALGVYASVWRNDIQILNKRRIIYPEFKNMRMK